MALTVRAVLGTVRFHGWKDSLHDLSNIGERFARLGQTGSGSQITGVASPETDYPAWIACTNLQDALAAQAAIEALPFTTVTLTDQWNQKWLVRVTKVGVDVQQGKGTAVSGTSGMTHLVSATISLEVLA